MQKIIKSKSVVFVKIMCVVFAFFTWLYVMSNLDPIDTRNINSEKVKIENIEELQRKNLTVMNDEDLNVEVKLKGRRSFLSEALRNGVSLGAVIKNPKEGENLVYIKPLKESNDLTYEINPAKLNIVLEKSITKLKKLNVNLIGNLPKGYTIDMIKLSNESVYVTGASSTINKISTVNVDIDLKDKYSDFSESVPIKVKDRFGTVLDKVDLKDKYTFVTVKLKKEKEVEVKADFIENVDDFSIKDNYIKINPSKIKINGPAKIVDSIKYVETSPISSSKILEEKTINAILKPISSVDFSEKLVKVEYKLNDNLIETNIETVDNGKDENKIKKFVYPINSLEFFGLDEETKAKLILPSKIFFEFKSAEDVTIDDIKLFVRKSDIKDNKAYISYFSDKNIDNVNIKPLFLKVDNSVNEEKTELENNKKEDINKN